jgi:hypothetical protein
MEAMPDDRRSTRNRQPAEPGSERDSRHAWEDEGGSVDERLQVKKPRADQVVSGRIVQAGGPGRRYKVVLTHEDGRRSEYPCATMREGEAFIRRAIPTPPKRNTSRDRPPGKR